VQGAKPIAGGAGVSPESFSLLFSPRQKASYEGMWVKYIDNVWYNDYLKKDLYTLEEQLP